MNSGNLKGKVTKKKLISFFKNIKRNSKSYFCTNILFLTFILTSLINGFLLRALTVKNYFAVKPVLADISILLFLGAFAYFIKPKHQFKYFFTLGIILTLLCIINSMYYVNYVSFASFSLLATSLQIIDVSDAVVQNVMELKDFCYLWQIFALLFVNSTLKRKNYFEYVTKIEKGRKRAINTIVVAVIVFCVFASTLTSVDISRLNKQWNRESLVMEFGIYTYQINDLFVTLKSQISPLFGYDESAKEFREFYSERNKTIEEDDSKKEYSNLYKGKNILVIHAESIQNFTLNTSFNGVDVAPNLKKLASEGLYFSNFHAQESVGTSSDSEFTFLTSLLPASSGTVFISYWDRDYVTIPKLLKEQGYYTFSMHANNGTFWNRSNAHKSLGYDDFYYYTKDFTIDEKIGLGLTDKSFFRQAVPKISEIRKNHKNFYGLLIMLTNHTPFTDIENYSDYEVTYKYKKINKETGEEEEVVAPYMEGTKLGSYFKSVHYADEAIGELIQQLDEAGILDDTVIVIYGDHDAKLKKSEYVRYYNYDYENDKILDKDDPNYVNVDYYNYELNRGVPLIIWTKDNQQKKEIKKVMGMYDVLPTLGNLFGFKSEYALGNDILNTDENVVVFPDGNWLTDKMYYSQSKGEGKLLNPDDTVSVDYINKYNKIAEKYISVSNSIIVYDLIKKTKESEELKNSE